MDLESLAYVAEIAAAIAVVVTLVYVAAQVKLNTQSNNASAYQLWLASNLQVNAAASDESMSKTIASGHEDSANLSKDDFIKFALWQMSFFQHVQAIDYLYRTGSLDHALWRSEVDRAALHLTLPGVRQWWDAGGKTQLTAAFVELIESTSYTSQAWNWEEGRGFVIE
jgi:hypothetical protein